MASATKTLSKQVVRAKVTSKGQVTIPVEVRRAMGVRAGDRLRFEPQEGGFRVVRDVDENPFEKWRGIGTGFPIKGTGREAIFALFREMRGHDDLD